MENCFIPYRNSVIHYCVYGNGDKLLFCLHGYGEDANSFAFMEPLLGKDYTMIAINLPFHGKTEWKDDLLFTPNDLLAIISQINRSTSQPINFLAYSMGGRIAVQLMQLIPAQIERAVLIAPDGLHKNFWYWLSTQTYVGNKLFAFTMKHPGWLFAMMETAGKFNLLIKSILKIAHYYLDEPGERNLLYKRWTTMRKFRPHLSSIRIAVKKNKISVRFLFGHYDKIILSRRSDFFKGDEENITVQVIEAGHQLLKEKYAAEIAKLFYQ